MCGKEQFLSHCCHLRVQYSRKLNRGGTGTQIWVLWYEIWTSQIVTWPLHQMPILIPTNFLQYLHIRVKLIFQAPRKQQLYPYITPIYTDTLQKDCKIIPMFKALMKTRLQGKAGWAITCNASTYITILIVVLTASLPTQLSVNKPAKGEGMAQLLEPLPPTWAIRMELKVPGFRPGPVLAVVANLQSKPANGRNHFLILFLFFCCHSFK